MTAPEWEGRMARISQRLVARLIDTAIMSVPVVGLFVLLDAGVFLRLLIGSAVTGGYEVGMLSGTGQTVGKRLQGIRVVGPDGGLPTPGQAAKRWGVLWAVGLIPIAGFMLSLLLVLRAVVSPDRRGGHDLVADTWVVVDQPG